MNRAKQLGKGILLLVGLALIIWLLVAIWKQGEANLKATNDNNCRITGYQPDCITPLEK